MLFRPMMMRGAAAVAAATAWSKSDKDPQVTVSSDGLTASTNNSDSNYYGVRSTVSRSGGAYYAELLMVSGTAIESGLSSASGGTGDAYYDPKSAFYFSAANGLIYRGSSQAPGSYGGGGPGTVIGLAWDDIGKTVAFYKNGSLLTTLTGYNPAVPMFLYAAIQNTGSDAIRTTAAQFTQAVPSGFVPWG